LKKSFSNYLNGSSSILAWNSGGRLRGDGVSQIPVYDSLTLKRIVYAVRDHHSHV
jgi:hypothetical protein